MTVCALAREETNCSAGAVLALPLGLRLMAPQPHLPQDLRFICPEAGLMTAWYFDLSLVRWSVCEIAVVLPSPPTAMRRLVAGLSGTCTT